VSEHGLPPLVRPRARAWGLRLGDLPTGPRNAITDVDGVRVGHVTVIHGEGCNAARCGVTAVLAPGDDPFHRKLPAAAAAFNGCGEMTGLWWVNESGFLETPILMTDTLSIGRVLDGAISWMLDRYPRLGREEDVFTPVVGECDNSFLNDIRGRHVTSEHVRAALDTASGGPVAEGAVGAGTGMTCYDFKGGIGTASRVVDVDGARYTVGALINDNHGRRKDLVLGGTALGDLLTDRMPLDRAGSPEPEGSFILVIATDAPLDARALSRLAQRAWLGVARTGGKGNRGSGDFALAFSTRNVMVTPPPQGPRLLESVDESRLNPLFDGVVEAVEEAIVNALFAGTDMVGRDGNTVFGLPLDALAGVLRASG